MTDSSSDAEHRGGFFGMLSLFVLSASLPVLFLLGFSGMGYGLEVVTGSYDYHDEAAIVIQSTLIFMALMYIFDSQYWPIPIRILSWFSVFMAFCISMCLLVAEVPYGPICVFTVLMPLLLFGIKNVCYANVPAHVFVGRIYVVLVFMATLIVFGWFYWCAQNGNMWDSETNAIYSHAAGCRLDFTDLERCKHPNSEGVPCFFNPPDYSAATFSHTCNAQCLDVYQACTEAFITWSNPGLAAMALFVIGFISKYLSDPDDPHAHHQISAVAKFCVIFLFLFWIFASMVGAGEGLSSSLIAFAISMVIGSSIIFSAVFWRTLVARSGEEVVGGAAKQASGYADFLRGLVILGFSPVLLVYLAMSMLNQLVRRALTRHSCRRRVPDAAYEHNGWLTLAGARQIDDFKSWDHAKVLSYAVYWGVGYVFLNVLASKFTTVFLSWLIEVTNEMTLFAVTLIVVGVGLFLFMLPPIPGLPIYLTGGIVLVSVGRDALGLWGAVGYACVVSLLLKLLACGVQQKLIGAKLGDNIGVKQMVSINSEGIRAMRVMLSDRGITGRKVAVLVGGPDWPVSVLCGVLGLDLFPILVGTVPVVALIVPTVLCGSFAYMGSLENEDGMDLYPWADTMGAVASAVAAGAMFYFNLAAASAVKDTLAKDKEIIDAIPIDEAVREANAEAEKKNIIYRRVTAWSGVPFVMKCILITAVLLMMGCCYLLMLFNTQCFREYDLMYTIGEHLGGKWTNIVMPLGRIALLLFISSYGFLYMFQFWATAKMTAEMEAMDPAEIEALAGTEVATYA